MGWLEILEAEFHQRLVDPTDKYSTLKAALPITYQNTVAEVSVSAPDRYERLKALILRRATPTEREAVRGVLCDLQLGQDQPSALLRKMNQLLGDRKIDAGILKEIWLQKLPPLTQSILAGTSIMDLDGLAQVADNVVSTNRSMEVQVATISQPGPSSQMPTKSANDELTLESLFQHIMTLQQTVERQNSVPQNNRSSRSRSRRRSQSRSPSRRRYDTCWYHYKFGIHAKRCQSPCNFARQQTSQSGNDHARM